MLSSEWSTTAGESLPRQTNQAEMKLCAVSESLGHLPFPEAAKVSADLGLAGLEIGTGNWCAAPHAKLQSLLESKEERRKFLDELERNELELAALNCNGNQLHPVDGERQGKVVSDTVRVAEMLGVDKIVLMSGLPAGGPNDRRPNWVTCAWPLENGEILHCQSEECEAGSDDRTGDGQLGPLGKVTDSRRSFEARNTHVHTVGDETENHQHRGKVKPVRAGPHSRLQQQR